MVPEVPDVATCMGWDGGGAASVDKENVVEMGGSMSSKSSTTLSLQLAWQEA